MMKLLKNIINIRLAFFYAIISCIVLYVTFIFILQLLTQYLIVKVSMANYDEYI